MTDFIKRIRQIQPRNRVPAAILACAILLSAATAVLLTLWDGADASSLTPGTAEYYDARWEEAKIEAGNLEASTAYTNNSGNTAATAVEGPWMLENLDTKYTNDEISAPWSGNAGGTRPTRGSGTTNSPYLVYTAEEFRYCIVNRSSCTLMKDIDLGGYLGNSWSSVAGNTTDSNWVVNGNGHVIYNYYCDREYVRATDAAGGSTVYGISLFGVPYNLTVSNLKISNSYIIVADSVSIRSAFFAVVGTNISFSNCAVENVMMWKSASSSESFATSFAYSIQGTIDNCYTRNAYIYNEGDRTGELLAHVIGFGTLKNQTEGSITNSFVADSILISNGGHSGGFMSCGEPYALIENCFTADVTIYGNKQVGGFLGIVNTNADITFRNCYASGTLEGTEDLGGFIASPVSTSSAVTFENCYSTVLVGLESDGSNLGGFAGRIYDATNTYTFTNCYAAGEVGNIDTNSDADRTASESGDVGGFIGDRSNGVLNIDNCYYDKQTTAMREWAVGSASSAGYTDTQAQEAGWDITGLLTTTTDKSGVSMTDTEFADMLNNGGDAYNSDLGDGYYPQLTVFSSATTFTNDNWMTLDELQSMVKAYSQASVSTVHLNTYDTDYDGDVLPETTYDTVRDLTSRFTLTSNDNIEWSRVGVTGEATSFNGTGAQSTVDFGGSGSETDVLQLYEDDDGNWYAAEILPGVDWVSVSCDVNGQIGSRNIRVCPTAGIEAGISRSLGYGTLYDHADDVKLAYTTGSRQAAGTSDITYGVFPDVPLEDEQAELLARSAYKNTADLEDLFDEQDDEFENIDVLHMQRTDESLTATPSKSEGVEKAGTLRMIVYVIDEAGNYVTDADGNPVTVDLDEEGDLWNGKEAFSDEEEENIYSVEYVWVLADGRYVTDTKRVEVSFHTHTVTIMVYNNKDELISNKVYLDAYSISDGTGGVEPDATFDFGSATKSMDRLTAQYHAQPAATSWQLKEDVTDEIKELRVKVMAMDAGSMYDEITISGSLLPQTAGESATFTLTVPYISYSYDADGNLVSQQVNIDKEYTVNLDENGVYTIEFALEYTDPDSGVYVDDLDMDIEVTVVLDTDDSDEDPVLGRFQIEKKLSLPAEEDEVFMFKIEYRGQGEEPGEVEYTMYARIDILAGGQVGYAYFVEQEPGWYTVTELDSNWRFEPDGNLEADNPNAEEVDVTGNSVTYWVD